MIQMERLPLTASSPFSYNSSAFKPYQRTGNTDRPSAFTANKPSTTDRVLSQLASYQHRHLPERSKDVVSQYHYNRYEPTYFPPLSSAIGSRSAKIYDTLHGNNNKPTLVYESGPVDYQRTEFLTAAESEIMPSSPTYGLSAYQQRHVRDTANIYSNPRDQDPYDDIDVKPIEASSSRLPSRPPSYKTTTSSRVRDQKPEQEYLVKTKRVVKLDTTGELILPPALKHPSPSKKGSIAWRKIGTNPLDMTATVTSPSNNTETCDIVDVDDCHYSINFVPKEMGVHTVAVRHQGSHIPGSPFQFTVGPITDGGTHKVRAAGPGLQSGVVDSPNYFNIFTREAGAGGLSIAIEGPSKADIDFDDQSDGSCGVTYQVSDPGDYSCSIKFNDEHIPGSPFRIYIGEGTNDGQPGLIKATDAKTLSLGTGADKGLQIGRPAAFTVNYTGAKSSSNLRAYVKTPSGTEDEAIIQTVERDQYAIRFIPRENGPHLIHVVNSDDNTPIPGSPFRFLVGQYDADPGMVHASGDGLTRGVVNEKNRFFINTVNAGSGALNVTVDGPSKVQLNCHEKESGYEFTYLPTEPGDYTITVKYGGNYHIVGSPFTAHVSGSGALSSSQILEQQSTVLVETVDKTTVGKVKARSDSHPERVTCHGLGLKVAHTDRLNQFSVDATNAGMDILLVGIAGPERPCDEVTVKHIGRNQFSVNYRVIEKGSHLLMIKWGDQHVPGSPFIIDVP